jgi:hypothetical protein
MLMLSVMLNVFCAEYNKVYYAECHYAECHHDECPGAIGLINQKHKVIWQLLFPLKTSMFSVKKLKQTHQLTPVTVTAVY